MTDTDAAPIFPPGRYGRRREPAGGRTGRAGRRRVLFFAAVGAVFGLLLAVVLYQRYGAADFQPQVLSFQLSPGKAELRFSVHKPSGGAAVCHVRARNRDGAEVGAADVDVPAGQTVTVTYTLETRGTPFTAEVPTCHGR